MTEPTHNAEYERGGPFAEAPWNLLREAVLWLQQCDWGDKCGEISEFIDRVNAALYCDPACLDVNERRGVCELCAD